MICFDNKMDEKGGTSAQFDAWRTGEEEEEWNGEVCEPEIHVLAKKKEKKKETMNKKAALTKLFLLSFRSKLPMRGPPLTLLKRDISFRSLLPSFKTSAGGRVLRSSNLGYS